MWFPIDENMLLITVVFTASGYLDPVPSYDEKKNITYSEILINSRENNFSL